MAGYNSGDVDWDAFYKGILPAKPSTTQYFPRDAGQSYGYNTVTGAYEPKRGGQGYASVPAPRFPTVPSTALAAIGRAAPAELPSLPSTPMAFGSTAPVGRPATMPRAPAPTLGPITNVTAQMRPQTILDALFTGKGGGFTMPSLRNTLSNLFATGAAAGFPALSAPSGLFGSSATQSSPWWQQVMGDGDSNRSGGFDGSGGGGGLT